MNAVTQVPRFVIALLLALLPVARSLAAPVIETDICIYGGTSGGAIAAVQAARQGKRVALAVFGTRVGGMTSGGLTRITFPAKGPSRWMARPEASPR